MPGNRCVVYVEPGKVSVETIDYPKLELPEQNRKCDHGVILKIVATNICGSDQHMVRGRTTAPKGQTLGHEITGEVIELGRDVEFIKMGDLVSVPFNIACGRCRMCKAGNTGVCLNVNPARPGAAYEVRQSEVGPSLWRDRRTTVAGAGVREVQRPAQRRRDGAGAAPATEVIAGVAGRLAQTVRRGWRARRRGRWGRAHTTGGAGRGARGCVVRGLVRSSAI